jgi:hypothetical protein
MDGCCEGFCTEALAARSGLLKCEADYDGLTALCFTCGLSWGRLDDWS